MIYIIGSLITLVISVVIATIYCIRNWDNVKDKEIDIFWCSVPVIVASLLSWVTLITMVTVSVTYFIYKKYFEKGKQ